MKEKDVVSLAQNIWKIVMPLFAVAFFAGAFLIDFDLIRTPLFVIVGVGFLCMTYRVFRLKLVIDYENEQIIYYSFKKHVINFDDVNSCHSISEASRDNNTFYFVVLNTVSEEIKITCNFTAFSKESFDEKRREITKLICTALKNAEETVDNSIE